MISSCNFYAIYRRFSLLSISRPSSRTDVENDKVTSYVGVADDASCQLQILPMATLSKIIIITTTTTTTNICRAQIRKAANMLKPGFHRVDGPS